MFPSIQRKQPSSILQYKCHQSFNAFRKEDSSAFKKISPIRAAVQAQFGKNSIEFNQVDAVVKQIRASKLIKFPATENTAEHALSQSEQSYGSTTQFFTDLIDTLGTLNNYNPSNPNIQVATLTAFKDNLSALNDKVAVAFKHSRSLVKIDGIITQI